MNKSQRVEREKLHKEFIVWWQEKGCKLKLETNDEKDWYNVVKYHAWAAFVAGRKNNE